MNRKLNYEGPLKSDYAFMCPDKLEPREDTTKPPVDYIRHDSRSFAKNLDKAKPSRWKRFWAWFNTPVGIR